MTTPTVDTEPPDPTARAEGERLATFAKRCIAGERDPFDGLTDCERSVLQALKEISYELASERGYPRYIRRTEAA